MEQNTNLILQEQPTITHPQIIAGLNLLLITESLCVRGMSLQSKHKACIQQVPLIFFFT